ncbi:choice-of-anchor L domain-containing protein, partial [Flavobacterium soli]|uniref:choice-of-anchor L domain-containing protein n=1 Tax=Flavobacterium soli TaxID=344881 RepID=UPI0005572B7D
MKRLLLLLVFLVTTFTGFAQADVVVTNTNNQNLYVSGASIVYYVTVHNNGPSQATDVQVSFPIPAGFTASWTGSNGSYGSNALLNTIPVLAYNQEITYTLTLNVPAGYTGTLSTTASATTGSVDPNLANNEATDADARATTGADLVIINTDYETYYIPGTNGLYVITLKNNGPQVATDVHFLNAKPAGIDVSTWYSSNGTSGSGNISNEMETLAVGATVTYYFTVNIPDIYAGTMANIANVSSPVNDPIPENNTNITDYNIKAINADVKVSITDNQTIYTPGGTASYTVVVKNDGPLAATNVNVVSTFPAGIATINWSGNSTSGTGALNNVIANLASGVSVTYTIDIQIPSTFTGNLVAQVSATEASPPSPDPVLANNTATDTDVQVSGANITVTNTNLQTTYAQGSTTTYTITVTNNGPEVATDVNVFNAMPNGVVTATWDGNSTTGTGDLQNVIPTLAVGASVVYTFEVEIPSNYLGNLKSETVISGPTFDPYPTCSNCIDIDTPGATANANVAVTITDGQSSYVANQTLTYTATVTNNGPTAASNVHVVVPIPNGITNFSWTGNNGSSGTNTGLNNTIVSLPNGQSVVYTIVLQIPAGFTGNLVNQISATSATNDPVLTNNTAIDTDTPATSGADIKITNTNNTNFFIPGADSVYTITVTNEGPQTAYNVKVNNPLPTGVTAVSWTDGGTQNGLTAMTTANNNIAQLNVGESYVYTVTMTIAAGQTANIVNVATALAQTPADPNQPNQSTDTDVLGQSDISVTNTTTESAYILGDDIIYTVTVTNNGPREATNVVVENLIPAGITAFSWTGDNSSFGTDVPLNNTIPTLASGASVIYTITIGVPLTFTGDLVTTASATGDVPDPILTNNQATVTTPWGQYDIEITNTNGQAVYTLGGTSNYSVTVTNNGPNDATNVVIENLIPAGITDFSWTGNGNPPTVTDLVDTIALLEVGDSVVYTIELTVPNDFTGNVVSTATATISGDFDESNNTATDTDVFFNGADVSISVTDNATTYIAGTSATYTVVVNNIGTTTATNVVVNSVVPAGVTNYTWSGNGANGTGAINNTIASLESGEMVEYTITFFIPGTYTADVVTEVSIVNADTNLTNNTSTDTNIPSAGADLVVVNTDGVPSYVAGQIRTYTIQVTNYGPQAAQNVEVLNPVPAGIDPSTVTWSGNATSGTGNLQNVIPTLAVGQTVSYTFIVPVPTNFPQNANLVSEVSVTTDTVDPNPGCTQCVDVDTPTAFADLVVTKSDGRTTFLLSDNDTAPPQTEYVNYLITVKNNGPSDAMNVTVQDLVPVGINNVNSVVWNGSNGTSGTGSLNQVIGTLPAGQMVTYNISIRMPTSFNSFSGNLVNTATASTSTNDNNVNNNTATDINFPSKDHITIEPGKDNPAIPTYDVTQLVRDILINEPCVDIFNYTSSANSAQFGYFHKNNSSFPIKDGIILTSGNITTLDAKYDGSSSTAMGNATPDPDLQMVMNANGLTNQNRDASFVKFHFIPMGSEFSFNYLFASQEYSNYQCSGFYDSFAFILTNEEDGTWENLAVVPESGDMVSVVTIKKGIYGTCGDMNAEYFGVYNSATNVGTAPTSQANVDASAINLRGQTIKMKAATTVEPGVEYSIKLIAADASDQILDTAVFIEAGSFNIGGPRLTGTGLYADDEDFSGPNAICEGTTRTIRAALEANPDIVYTWYKDDVLIPGANTYFIEVSEPGVYRVVFEFVELSCSQSDFIIVEFTPPPFDVEEAEDLYVCNDATPEFDLTVNKAIVLQNFVEEDFDAYYYHTAEDAELGQDAIPVADLTAYPGVDGETIYIKVVNMFSGGYCDPIKPFQLFLTTAPSGTFAYTDDGGEPGFCIGSSTSMLPVAPGLTAGGIYTATPAGLTIVDPATGEINVNTSLEGVYTVKYEFTGMGCDPFETTTEVIISPCVTTIADNSGPLCEGTPTFDLTATDAGAGATYEWKDYNGNVISTDQNPTGVIVPATPGDYIYTVVATIGTSSSSPIPTTLTVHPTPTAQFDTPASNPICTGGEAQIQVSGTPGAIVTISNGTIEYDLTLDAVSGIGNVTFVNLLVDTTYSLVKVVSTTTPPCEFIFAPSPFIEFTVGLPTATMVGFTDPVICLGTTGTFTIQGTPGATVTYTVDGNDPETVVLPATGELSVETPIQDVAGVFTYELTEITTPGPDGCSNMLTGETATLTVNALPTATFATTTPTVCQDTPATIQFTGTPGAIVTYNFGGADDTVTLDALGNFELTTPNLPDPTLSYTFTLVSVEQTLSGVTCSADLTGSLTIEVDDDPVFVSITPNSGTVLCIGDDVTLQVVATGANLSYQWYKNDTTQPVGTDQPTFTISNAASTDAGEYFVVISGSCGTPVTSTIVELILNQPTVITDEPDAQTVCEGQAINLEVVATGVDLTYQWYKGANTLLPTETSSILNIASATLADAGTYRCEVINDCQTVSSQTVVVTVNQLPAITVQPVAPAAICVGEPISMSVSATGTGLTYQWYLNSVTLIPGATSANYNDPSVTLAEAGDYTVVVSGTCAPAVTSTIATVVVNEGATIVQDTQASPSDTVCSGDPIILSIITTGGTNPTYQWQIGGVNIPGETGQTLTINATQVSDTGIYTCVISSDSCPSFSSSPLAVTVNQAPAITDQPDSEEICVGDTHSLTVEATGTNVTYQWYKDTFAIPTATSNVYTMDPATLADSGDYYCVISSASCASITSDIVTLTVRPLPVATIANGTEDTICSGESSEIVFTGTPGAVVIYNIVGVLDNETVQLNAVTGEAIVATGTLTETTTYELVSVTYTGVDACSQDLTGSATVTVNELPEVTIEDGYICVDPITGAVTRTYTFDTGLNDAQYIFEWSDANGVIVGASSSFYEASAVGQYAVKITDVVTLCEQTAFATVDQSSPPISFDYTVNDYFSQNPTVVITAQPAGDYEYQLDYGPFQESNVFDNISMGEHTITVRDPQACDVLTDVVTIIDYPKYFTPNGDGI